MVRPDLTKTNVLFIFGVMALAIASWAARFSHLHISLPLHRHSSTALYGLAAVFAVLSFTLQMKRSAQPWKVSAGSVSLSYILFFVIAMAGIAVHRFGI